MMARNGAFLSTLNMVACAAVWKSTPQSAPASLPLLMLGSLATIATSSAYEYVAAGVGAHFALYGINAHLAALLVTLAVAALFVHRGGRVTFLSAMMLLSAAISLLYTGATLAHWVSPYDSAKVPSLAAYAKTILIDVISLIWWGGAVFALLRSIGPARRFKLSRTVGLCLGIVLAASALPYEPVFRGRDFDIRTANLWETVAAIRNGSFARDAAPKPRRVDRAQIELAQPALMDAQISHLSPRVKGKTNIYAVGIAGSSDQDVFVKEPNGGLSAIARVFPLGGVVRLVNNVDTTKTIPVASRQNFAAAIRAVSRTMDRDNDVLLLFMTSHGSQSGVALWLPDAVYADLSPTEVAAVLDRDGIKNRIIIVSACYSGVFLKPLENSHTIVLTAADRDHPSFGCSNERSWTYFGDAFFNRNLLPGGDIREAFLNAKVTITQWEVHDGAQPSNPQGYFGRDLMNKLAPLYRKSLPAHALRQPADRRG